MPRRQPFTRLCQLAASIAQPELADLHVHTTTSDGSYTPSQVVALAVRAGLKAIAITDHDAINGWHEAVNTIAINRFNIALIPGVEISTSFQSVDLHILAYDFQDSQGMRTMLGELQLARRERFQRMINLLREQGNLNITREIEDRFVERTSLGRRHVAELLVMIGAARSRHDAFRRYVLPMSARIERLRTSCLEHVVACVHEAGGFVSLAHPSNDLARCDLERFQQLGLDAVEVEFPSASRSRSVLLRQWAQELGLGCTGGSDSHGQERRIGDRSVPMRDLEELRRMTRR